MRTLLYNDERDEQRTVIIGGKLHDYRTDIAEPKREKLSEESSSAKVGAGYTFLLLKLGFGTFSVGFTIWTSRCRNL